MNEEKQPIQWVTEKNWDEFRNAGLGWFVNSILHVFGWALVWDVDENGKATNCYPARVKYRGWDEKSQSEGHKRLAEYMENNAYDLKKETEL